jgi:hypothetical protein
MRELIPETFHITFSPKTFDFSSFSLQKAHQRVKYSANHLQTSPQTSQNLNGLKQRTEKNSTAWKMSRPMTFAQPTMIPSVATLTIPIMRQNFS